MAAEKERISEQLSKLLASTYMLYLKTQNFHWNVTGPFFQTLHLMFEDQYNELAMANDAIAERIRTLGGVAPGTFHEFMNLSFLSEPKGVPKANEMVRGLVSDHESLIQFSKSLIEEAAGDDGTIDLLTGRVSSQEKTVWMLRSFLEQ